MREHCGKTAETRRHRGSAKRERRTEARRSLNDPSLAGCRSVGRCVMLEGGW